ncbi:MAG: exo-alpha-sialidase [Actinomycetota bacterium]|nr:exo-alpha-sialidase [Actinomycetota bacterium]
MDAGARVGAGLPSGHGGPRQALVLVGTVKGVFVLRGDATRRRWQLDGPLLAGQEIAALALAHRDGRPLLLAGGHSEHWGPAVMSSDDLGRSWVEAGPVRFPVGENAAVTRIWQLQPGAGGALYAGVEPAALFVSLDGGASFELVRSLWDHPHRPQWQPGGGGLCLHTVIEDPTSPKRLWVAISTGGVYRSSDGGETWQARNAGIATPFLPVDEPPEFGQCVHKVDRHPTRPDTLFLQHHWGVYRSDDGGDSWHSIGDALPSDFGFPVVVDPNDADTVYVIPLASDMFRCTPDGRCRVYRTADGGATWTALTTGLPQEHAHLTVLRDAFTADDASPTGLYFGTRSGEVFSSADAGASWSTLARHLPAVLCVRAGMIG